MIAGIDLRCLLVSRIVKKLRGDAGAGLASDVAGRIVDHGIGGAVAAAGQVAVFAERGREGFYHKNPSP